MEKLLTYNEVLSLRTLAKYRSPEVRYGQALMTGLFYFAPDLYAAINATEADCFYDDRKIGNFWAAISATANN